ncbi:Zn-ribbon domain-containing OB-fold protein [Streptomyces sp. NBC_00467]|uniref:Zn-ribbon domain-containing OB-fold protein n=1 Tax=Streptomyces sp. NBC_00467 TaxID=2975752 RepID=UPI002E196646
MSATPPPPPARHIGADWTHQDGKRTTLTITVCRACSGRWFPPRDSCSACASGDVEDIASDTRGIVYASSVVRIAPRGFQAPYVLAYVDISGVRILVHSPSSDRALAPGTPVELTVTPIADTGDGTVTSYAIIPLDDQHTPTGEER